jgi:diguanylate cyclase (GGDEF)-like protein/hemerythrin-like metal-binding protein/PAS domain S-box-containing protein
MSPIDIFVWNESFNTGLREVDEQHLRLVQLINRVAGKLALDPGLNGENGLGALLEEFRAYAQGHFRFEEALWGRYMGGQLSEARHRQEHRVFEDRLAELMQEAREQPSQEVLEHMLDYLVRWLAGHILGSDQRMARSVRALSEGKAPELVEADAEVPAHEMTRAMIDIILSVYGALSRNTLMLMRELAAGTQRERQLQLAASVFEQASEAIMITDPQAVILEVNDAFTRITGFAREEAVGRNARLLRSDRHSPDFFRGMWQSLLQRGRWSGEVWGRRRDGQLFAKQQTISAVRGEDGAVLRYVSLFTDITAAKHHQQELEHVVHHDPLTHLPNRLLLGDRLQQSLARGSRLQEVLAVAVLDLDGFKTVNEVHGHALGDRLLVLQATRMRHWLREGDTLARLGGDEFVVVLQDLQDAQSARPILERLLQSIAQPLEVEGRQLSVTASLGVSFFNGHEQGGDVDADQLLRQAEQAMVLAKQAGRNRIEVFDAAQERLQRGRQEELQRIADGLRADEFTLHYQPKVNMRSGAVVGVEALIRWQHPQRGLLAPIKFLPLIEGDALAVELDRWVLRRALAQLQRWREAGLNLPVAINASARWLNEPDFLLQLHEALAACPAFQPGDLEIEVLETRALDDLLHVAALVQGCRALGVRVALDDFGTGYSSLAYLKRLGVDTLKVDQGFVRDCLEDADDLAILDAVRGLAGAFGCALVAEGVETVAHGQRLLQLGYETVQGYAVARPLQPDELLDWLQRWRTPDDWAG